MDKHGCRCKPRGHEGGSDYGSDCVRDIGSGETGESKGEGKVGTDGLKGGGGGALAAKCGTGGGGAKEVEEGGKGGGVRV